MNRRFFVVWCMFLGMPFVSHAQVLLSEIAWMGTDANPSAEWIEIYNFSTSPTDVTGWTLASDDGALSITLSGTLPPHGVVLVERDSDASVPGVSALLTYTGEMSDAGTTITVRDTAGSVSDSASGGSGWSGIGGTLTSPVKTAQRTRMGTWVTAAPTPGRENAQVSDPVLDGEVVSTTSTSTGENLSGGVTSRSGGGSSKNISKPTLSIHASSTAYVGKPVLLRGDATGMSKAKERALSYYWNFGDMHTGEGREETHTYAFPGEYVVALVASTTGSEYVTRHDITVLPRSLTLSFTKDGDIVITNIGEEEIRLDGYTLSGGIFSFTFPPYSFLKANAALTIGHDAVDGVGTMMLTDVDGDIISTAERNDVAEIKDVKEIVMHEALTYHTAPTLRGGQELPMTTVSRVTAKSSTSERSVLTKRAPNNTATILHPMERAVSREEPGFLMRVMSRLFALFE